MSLLNIFDTPSRNPTCLLWHESVVLVDPATAMEASSWLSSRICHPRHIVCHGAAMRFMTSASVPWLYMIGEKACDAAMMAITVIVLARTRMTAPSMMAS